MVAARLREPSQWHDDEVLAAALELIEKGQRPSPNSELRNELLHRGLVRRDRDDDEPRLHLTREGRDLLNQMRT